MTDGFYRKSPLMASFGSRTERVKSAVLSIDRGFFIDRMGY